MHPTRGYSVTASKVERGKEIKSELEQREFQPWFQLMSGVVGTSGRCFPAPAFNILPVLHFYLAPWEAWAPLVWVYLERTLV